MKKFDILYFVEHTAREFDIACLVKYFCEKYYKLSVNIASFHFNVEKTVKKNKARILVVPYFYSTNDSGIKTILKYWDGLVWFNLCFEQLISPLNKKFKAPKDDFARKNVYYFAWGDFFKDYLINHGVTKNHIFVGGNPALELFNDPYKNCYPSKEQLAFNFNLRTNKQWIFFPMNYGWAFFSDARLEANIINGMNRDIAYEKKEFNKRSLDEVLKWCLNAAQKFQEKEFIIRPRPAIPQELYINELLNITKNIPKNIHVIKEGSIREWIINSDIIMSSFSTSLLEAATIKKPIYMLEPYIFPKWLYCEWFDTVKHLRNKENFIKACSENQSNNIPQDTAAYIYQHLLKKENPLNEIVLCLNKLNQETTNDPKYIKKFANFCSDSYIKVKKITKFILAKFNLYKLTKNLDHHENDNFTEFDITERINEWKKILK